VAISYNFNSTSDTLEICSSGPTGTYYLFTTLTDDSGAFDQDTIQISVELPSALAEQQTNLPDKFDLRANFPNPFNPKTIIRYQLPEATEVTIKVFDTSGRLVSVLIDKKQSAGYHSVVFDAQSYASGIYFYIMKAGSFLKVRKMMLIK